MSRPLTNTAFFTPSSVSLAAPSRYMEPSSTTIAGASEAWARPPNVNNAMASMKTGRAVVAAGTDRCMDMVVRERAVFLRFFAWQRVRPQGCKQ